MAHHETPDTPRPYSDAPRGIPLPASSATRTRATDRRRTEKQAGNATFRSIFELAPDAAVVADAAGRILLVNQQTEALFGYPRQELLDEPVEVLLPERFHAVHPRRRARYVTAPRVRPMGANLRIFGRHRDGREFPIEVCLSPLPGRRDGDEPLVIAIIRDVSELQRVQAAWEAAEAARAAAEAARAEAERNAEQLDRIVEQMVDGLAVYDAHGMQVRINAAMRRILGLHAAAPDYSRAPLPERMILYRLRDAQGRLLAPEDWPETRALRDGATDTRNVRLRALDGREVEATASAAPLRDDQGRVVGAVGVIRDRTEQRRLEREREAARAREQAAVEFAGQIDQFFVEAAHDIRNPVASLVGYVQLAQQRADRLQAALRARGGELADLAAPVVAGLGAATASAEALHRLTERLFDIAQARAGRLELRLATCDLGAVVREQVAEQRMAAPARTIHLRLPDQRVTVLADADRLKQVLANYVTNALKYSADDRPVEVRLEVRAGSAVVSVQDQGSGLPPDEQEQVWELFHRASAAESESGGGLGLGLNICKRLVELHPDGRVGVESAIGRGATFWFSLPLADEAAARGDPGSAGSARRASPQPRARAAEAPRAPNLPDRPTIPGDAHAVPPAPDTDMPSPGTP